MIDDIDTTETKKLPSYIISCDLQQSWNSQLLLQKCLVQNWEVCSIHTTGYLGSWNKLRAVEAPAAVESKEFYFLSG